MSALGFFLDRMRREIAETRETIKKLGSPHSFPCPYCSRIVLVSYDKGASKLRHPPTDCEVYSKPTPRNRGDLIHAFVFHCRPTHKYGPMTELEKEAREVLK